MEVVQKQDNAAGVLSKTTINFYGPAYNAQQADNILGTLQNRDVVTDSMVRNSMVLQFQNHAADPVGGFVGRNSSTGGTIPEGSSVLNEMYRAGTGKENTSHNCYGTSESKKCAAFWDGGFPFSQTIQPNKNISNEVNK
jgi:filamentous hemagglutinin